MIYWGEGQGIERANLDGSYRSDVAHIEPPRFLAAGYISVPGGICELAVDSGHVYWADRANGTIGRANLDGSEPNRAFVTGASEPCGVAVDGSHVYWANLGGTTIGRAGIDGSNPDQSFVDTGHKPCGVAVSGSKLFWGAVSDDVLGRADLDGGAVEQNWIPEAGGGCGIAVDGSHVYFTDLENSIGRVGLDGSDLNRKLVTGLDRPGSVAVDGSHVYWDEESIGDNRIGIANLDGTGVNRDFLTGVGFLGGVAVDSGYYVLPPIPASSIRLGRTRRNVSKGIAFIPVDVPDSGQFRVDLTKGLAWRFAGEGIGPALSGGGRRWLRIWPDTTGWDAHHIRLQLRNKGRVRVRVSVTYSEIEKAPTTGTRSLVLVRKRRG